ncbi:Lysozyme [Mycena sanguinolenta]|uniref:Lysozyme n=1 Tax=Mycena sanguinolenta TaxID=230812 RepID=A0A8H7CFM9_9AGAR|nr:Lysozyme [Mycena sanguinolenta]
MLATLNHRSSRTGSHGASMGYPDEMEGHSVDMPRDSKNSLAGEADGSGADGDLLDIGDEVGFNNFDFEGGGDVDIAKNTGAAPVCSPPPNAATIQLVESFQPFSPNILTGPRVNTIGFGHRCSSPACAEAGKIPISRQTAQALLINDLIAAIQGVNNIVSPNVRLTLTDNQIGALASLLYTIGPQALRVSRLIANLEHRDRADH